VIHWQTVCKVDAGIWYKNSDGIMGPHLTFTSKIFQTWCPF